MNNMIQYQQRRKVLFTGRGELIMDNLMEHMPQRYQVQKCQTAGTELLRTINSVSPQVVVICLQAETRDTVEVFELLGEGEVFEEKPVIVIGKKEDCECFNKKLTIKNLAVFERPFDRDGFLNKLEEYEQMAWEKEEQEEKEDQNSQPILANMQDINLAEYFDWNIDEMFIEEKFLGMKDVQESLLKRIQTLTLIKGRKSILVVDDDVRMLNLIKLHLQDLYDITVVPSGKLALKFLEKKSVDLVLLDYMMPEMDGLEVLKHIRGMEKCVDLPVIFLTGVSDRDLVMKGLELHPKGYILKPATRAVLLERVTEIVLKI